jgi:phosphoribosyl 1,2-cyclic phosphodiesterase
LRFTSLSSGSGGNALVIESPSQGLDPTRILVDCGLGLKEVSRRLAARGLLPTDLDAIFVTHEHQDHIDGTARLARTAGIPVLTSHGTASAMPAEFWSGVRVIEIDSHARFSLGGLTLHCFPVPHDAREPMQLVVESRQIRIGVLTDVGRSTPHIEAMLSGVDALFLEANHDEQMLRAGGYPEALKQRIAGPYGHLSNAESASILAAIDQSRLQHVVAAHLSQHNNRPELVQKVLGPAIGTKTQMTIASQEEGIDWMLVD